MFIIGGPWDEKHHFSSPKTALTPMIGVRQFLIPLFLINLLKEKNLFFLLIYIY